jgi:hypothetical protein
VFYTDVAKVDRNVAHVSMTVHICCKLLFSIFHLFFSNVCCKRVYLDIVYVFTYMMQVFYLNVAYVYNGFKCFSSIFTSVSDACFKCFIYFQTYVASKCFKTRASVASPSSPFSCLTSVSSASRRRRFLLAWAGPTCLRAGATGEAWAAIRGTRDGGQRRRRPNGRGRGLAFGRPGASHALIKTLVS